MQLLKTKSRQLAQTHVHDSLRLQLVKIEALFQIALGVRRSLRGSDDMYHLVDIVAGNYQSFKDMSPLLRLFKVKLRAAYRHVMTMLNEVFHAFL